MDYLKNKLFFSDRLKIKIKELENGKMKDYLTIRYLNLLKRLELHTLKTSFFYYMLSLNVTFGSILMPPLLSIRNQEKEKDYFWTILIISLIVTSSNAIIKLFHLDKFYGHIGSFY